MGHELQELVVAQEAAHGVRGEAHLHVHAAVPGLPRERRHLAVELVRPPAPHRERPAPAEVVAVVHREPRRAAHGERRAVGVPQREAPGRRLPVRRGLPDGAVLVRHHGRVQPGRRPPEVVGRQLRHRRRRRHALDRVAEVDRGDLRAQAVPAVHRHAERCLRVGGQLQPRPRHGPPHVRAHRLEGGDLPAASLDLQIMHELAFNLVVFVAFSAAVGRRLQAANRRGAEVDDSLTEGRRCVERHRGAVASGEAEDSRGAAEEVAAEVRRLDWLATAQPSPRVEEVPE
uniref:Uncharacterized protein n=1 Tax=Triticum urartu TaxID=4572 RepID=A0A8R7P2D8_TRIUA